jgi:THO complex subunit 1
LSESNSQAGLERLKNPSRSQIPPLKGFKSKIELDDMDIDMAREETEKNAAIESKASKSWRALRIASTSKLVAFDKIDRYDKIDTIFLDHTEEPPTSTQEETNTEESKAGEVPSEDVLATSQEEVSKGIPIPT